ncbi:MAG: putative arsenate reductase [Acidimicrobiales bacterium]|nr:MAG: putative arsenate reductase [Acidimicrobiales bacterium]
MAEVTVYHNPRCSKSREALRRLEELGVPHDVVLYLENPPDESTLRQIVAKLEDPVRDLVRTQDARKRGIQLGDLDDADHVIELLTSHPEVMQRPLVVTPDRAFVARPTDRVDTLA